MTVISNSDSTAARGEEFDFYGSANARFTMPCAGMVTASAQAQILNGSASALVLTVIVSNDPAGQAFENHPLGITLTPSALMTQPFSVAPYLFFGVKLTTKNGSAVTGHIHLACSDATS